MLTLYKVTNQANDKSYIGWTDNLERRWKQHKRPSSESLCLRNAIQKYGLDVFTLEVLETCESDTYAKLLEIAAIKGFNTKTPNGYNMTDGGEGTMGRLHSEESKRRMSLSHTGKVLSKEHIQNIVEANTGRKRSEESKQKMSKWQRGVKKSPRSQEIKQKISKQMKQVWKQRKALVTKEI